MCIYVAWVVVLSVGCLSTKKGAGEILFEEISFNEEISGKKWWGWKCESWLVVSFLTLKDFTFINDGFLVELNRYSKGLVWSYGWCVYLKKGVFVQEEITKGETLKSTGLSSR